MGWQELYDTASSIVADHKGILAADESTGTIKKRFDTIGVESTEETRRAYRNLLFTTEGMEDSIGGVILYDETIRQAADDGTPFAELLAGKGVVPGIKVDTGAHDMAGFPGEKVTEGLDGLRGRLEEYAGLGARFATSSAFLDNAASNAVSRGLGYEENGRGSLAPQGVARETQLFRMSAQSWRSRSRPPVEIEGLDACREMFGI